VDYATVEITLSYFLNAFSPCLQTPPQSFSVGIIINAEEIDDVGNSPGWVANAVGTVTLVSVQTGGTPLQITTTSLPGASSGSPYPPTRLTATGGSGADYEWSVSSGSLPAGFTLSSAGVLSSTGIPAAAANSYSFTVQVTDPAGNLATQPLTLTVGTSCPVYVFLSLSGQYMQATFIPPNQETLNQYAAACGYDHFNWQQQITTLPGPSPFKPNESILINPANLCTTSNGCSANDGSLMATPSFPLYDPVPGSYTYMNLSYDPYPFVYPSSGLTAGATCTIHGNCPLFPYVVNQSGTTLSMVDAPADQDLFPGDFVAFSTSLVGVDYQGNAHTLSSWSWKSTYNGTAGGVSQTASIYPIDPGSGTGGVTITGINGVQLPPVVSPSQVSTTASGLAYSRVSQTFNGTVTLKNISSSAISGPLQIVFFGMPASVTLVNATSNLSGTPYLTVPAAAGLAPGQSTTFSVQFKNPSNVTLNVTPVIYSGGIN
jgi:hypothetical protein